MLKIIDTGDWGHSLYEVYLDLNGNYDQLKSAATGAFTVCFDDEDKVVLTNNEPLGGHLEKGETVEEALRREALEEGGMELLKWKYFGYYKVTQKDTASDEFKKKYPNEGYLIFFLSKGKKTMEPYGNDVKSIQFVDKKNVLDSKSITHKLLLEGVKLYPSYIY